MIANQRKARGLPGIRFEVLAPVLEDALPRMDVAGFVGFASRGPLHRPVPIEDVTQFEAVFGPDLPLAWDDEHQEMTFAHLAAAVRGFFRNGGRRCWVVRVADANRARANSFVVPLVKRETLASKLELRSRSVGHWSDDLKVRFRLEVEPCVLLNAAIISEDQIELECEPVTDLIAGDLLCLRLDSEDRAGLLSVVTSREDTRNAQGVQGIRVKFKRNETTWFHTPPESTAIFAAPAATPAFTIENRLQRLRLSITVEYPNGYSTRLEHLGFDSRHPRFWGALPDDDSIFDRLESDWRLQDAPRRVVSATSWDGANLELTGWPALWREVLERQFPLAGFEQTQPITTLPSLEMFDSNFDQKLISAKPQTAPRLSRDGLEVFDSHLFLDDGLRSAYSTNLLSQADAIRYGPDPVRSRLNGIHALLPVDEMTLLAVPDAVHRGWQRRVVSLPTAKIPNEPDLVIREVFEDCVVPFPKPTLKLISPPDSDGAFTLEIKSSKPELHYRLEEYLPLQEAPVKYDLCGATDGTARWNSGARANGEYGFRVRIEGEVQDCKPTPVSAWSDTLRVTVLLERDWQIVPIPKDEREPSPVWLDVQRAALRLSAARGDLFTVMALPGHLRQAQALLYASAVRAMTGIIRNTPSSTTDIPPLSFAEARALSFGAIYHPWLVTLENERSARVNVKRVRSLPPDGPVLGTYAARSLARGAWIAPANELLQGTLTLEPNLGRTQNLESLETRINQVLHEPSGFLVLSATTLANDLESGLECVNVRRLLSLLRRLALRIGARIVFEPNDAVLHRWAERLFTGMLMNLFNRGAFAGRKPSEAFQVRVNPDGLEARNWDSGRFVIELRVAPSRPLEFLTVRLVQTGDRGLLVQER